MSPQGDLFKTIRQVAASCRLKVMQKAPSGASCITFILHKATTYRSMNQTIPV